MMTATKASVARSVSFELVRAQDSDDGLTFEGYAAVFNTPVEIRSFWEAEDLRIEGGVFREQIAPSAFNKTIKDKAQWPLIDFEHGRHPVIGSMPIGVVSELRADSKGLFVRARLTDSWLIEPVRAAVRDGALTGMSIRAEPVSETINRDAKPPMVTRTEMRLIDLGPVTRPAYDTTTASVRSKQIAELLRDDPAARQDLLDALMTPIERSEPDTTGVSLDGDTSTNHDDGASSGDETGRPPEGHPPSVDRDEPPDGHSSMSTGHIRAQLARVNGLIDISERSALDG